MTKLEICSIGFSFPHDDVSFPSYHSEASLLDSDIILFSPILEYDTDLSQSRYQGKPNLSDASSVQNRESLKHWRSQLSEAYNSGATIFVFLKSSEKVFAATGTQELSGTGRNQKTIRHVGEIDSHKALPITFETIIAGRGEKVKLTREGDIIAPFWNSLSAIGHYECYFQLKNAIPLIVTKKGNKCVAARLTGKKGNLFLLPVLDFGRDSFSVYDEDKDEWFWSDEAVRFANVLVRSIIDIHKTISDGGEWLPPPDWVSDAAYILPEEAGLREKLESVEREIVLLRDEKDILTRDLDTAQLPKALLFGKGKILESAVIEALETLGFSAERYRDSESEFDVVFRSREGRFLGEIEGKDKDAVNIKKMQQLERNIQEDFTRDEVSEYAKGILFGNPCRLENPIDRTKTFTDKVISAAQRTGCALVLTSDLFPIVQYLRGHKNAVFADKVRKLLFDTKGAVVNFPSIPKDKTKKSNKTD